LIISYVIFILLSVRDPRNFIFQADKITLFQKFDIEVHNQYGTCKGIVKGFRYKLKVSRSSFRMHMRNRTYSSLPEYATSRRPEKGLCRSDYCCPIHIINIEIPSKDVNGSAVENYWESKNRFRLRSTRPMPTLLNIL
jgi:hypothetical protein